MSHQEGLVYFSLSEPTLFLCGEEDFDSNSLSSPLAHPDLSVSSFSNLLNHLNLLGDGALHLATGYLKKKKKVIYYATTLKNSSIFCLNVQTCYLIKTALEKVKLVTEVLHVRIVLTFSDIMQSLLQVYCIYIYIYIYIYTHT